MDPQSERDKKVPFETEFSFGVRLGKGLPPPAPPRKKAQKSFATLSEGQRLESLGEMKVGGQHLPAGSLFEVTAPCNLGVKFIILQDGVGVGSFNMQDREWKARFKRVRKPAKRKKKETPK